MPYRDLRASDRDPLPDLDDPGKDYGFIDTRPDAKPVPVPWYWTKPAVFAMAMIGLAVLAILVSAVLLVSRDSRSGVRLDSPYTTRSESPSPTAPPTTPRTVEGIPPPPSPTPESPTPESPPPEPPPPEPAPETTRPAPEPRSERPEIGVTRTPVTRSPISVAPQAATTPRS